MIGILKKKKKEKSEKESCWGIFLRKNKKFSGIHRTPLVYCDTEETAKKIMNDVEFHHYDGKYKNKDCVIKKITKKRIPENV